MPSNEDFIPYGVDFTAGTCRDTYGYSSYMLEKVSRTFALNIKVLPFALRKPVLLAYLFCRIADTVEDDPTLTPDEKKIHLLRFKAIFENRTDKEALFESARQFQEQLPHSWRSTENKDYSQLLSLYTTWPLESFVNLSDVTIDTISKWVLEMCDGMIKYSLKEKSGNRLVSLDTLVELDDYCYYVAGTVGFMLTDLFFHYSTLISAHRYHTMEKLSNSFGLGLQLTNIIKDVADDMTRDICFIPEELAIKHSISTENLLDPEYAQEGIEVLKEMIVKAIGHLEDAVTYTMTIPRLEPKIRLFCLWPVFMATATLVSASQNQESLLKSDFKLKITRREVKQIISRTTLFNFSNSYISKRFQREKATILRNLGV